MSDNESISDATAELKAYEFALRDAVRAHDQQIHSLRVQHKRDLHKREAVVERRYDLLLTETRREAAEAPRPLKSIIESLKAELRDERHAATNLRHNNSDLEKEITELNIELRRVRARLPTAGPVSSEAEKEIDALKRQADRMRATVLEQTDALTRDSKKKEELEQKVHELTQKLDEESVGGARSANAVKDVERRLGRRVEELEQKLKAKSEALINAESKLEELKRLPEQLQAKDEELKSVTRELEYAKQELGQVRDKYGNVNSSLQSSLRRDQDSLSTSEARSRTLTSQVDREKAKFTEEQRLRREAEKQIAKLKLEVAAWEKKSDTLTMQNAKLERSLRMMERNK